MIKQQFLMFVLRIIVSSFGMWLCIGWFGETDRELTLQAYLLGGLIFATINSFIKPVVTLISLPLAVLTVGLSSVLINIGMMLLAVYLLPGVTMTVLGALLSSLVMAIINSIANIVMPGYK